MSDTANRIGPHQQDPAYALSFRLRQAEPSAAPTACVILLHGVGSNEMSMAPIALTLPADTLVVLARAPLQFGPEQFGWFRVAFTANGPSINETEAEQSRQLLIDFVGQIQAAFDIDPSHTVIAGFSQGGIQSAGVALSAPEKVAGFAMLSGRILPELASRIADKARLKALRGFIGHGEFDSKLPVVWAQRANQLLDTLGVTHELHLYPIDHTISAAMHADFLAWVASLREVAASRNSSLS